MIIGILGSLVPLALLAGVAAVVVTVVRRRGTGEHAAGDEGLVSGHAVRRFFQYLLLAGLLFSAASGVAGLLGRLLDRDPVLVRDDSGLALQLTFTLIALPIWAALAWWTYRRLREDAQESRSLGWAAYLTLVGLVSLVVAMVAWHGALAGLLTEAPYRGTQLATAVVWTAIWAAHHWWGRSVTPGGHLRPLLLVGSLVGLGTAATGLAQTLSPALRELLGLTRDTLVGGTVDDILTGAPTFLVGAAAWVVYWALATARGPRDTGWLALVLLAGVAGGLLAAVVAASLLGYAVLVWLVGEPAARTATDHFSTVPGELAVLAVGLVVWWYHREVLGATRERRTEVRRVYEYLLSAVGLLAAAAGLVMVLVTVVEAIASGSDLVVGGSALNALLAALVLLAVGAPVWWWHWRQAEHARATAAAAELRSPTRRSYLLVLFGLSGVAAVVTLITLVYLLLEDALAGGVDLETMRSIRFPIGILATTSLLSAYHWTVFRADRAALSGTASQERPVTASAPPRQVLLVGAADPAVVTELQERSGARVQLLRRTDLQPAPWSVDDLVAALDEAPAPAVVVLAGTDGVTVVPVELTNYTMS
ncbi:hypothetical protein GCM10011509_18190 [Ornithinimicrobium pekingense]|uniref:DUF5671 domain-containing protein n=1 Tax=Ornithinimicrobium pekingense TaxID=384677 RepID=A0ABQ2F7X0_9MICO|nr:hypothetical protein GCM10011509_18190 [Ornithinimicrobium pekingense]